MAITSIHLASDVCDFIYYADDLNNNHIEDNQSTITNNQVFVQVLYNVCISYFLLCVLCEDWEIEGILWTISLHNVHVCQSA